MRRRGARSMRSPGYGRRARRPRRGLPAWTHDRTPPRLLLADRHGRRPGPRGAGAARGGGVHRRAAGARAPLPGADEQLDLHRPRPARPAAAQRHRRPRGGHLDVGAGDGAVPGRADAGRLGVRDRRGGDDVGAARGRLRDDRPRPRLRGPGRDPDLLVRGDHPGDPADRARGAVHRDEPRRHRAVARGAAARHRFGRGDDPPGDGDQALLRRQAQPADDALGAEPDRGPLGDDGDGRRPDGHRRRRRAWRRGCGRSWCSPGRPAPSQIDQYPYRPTRVEDSIADVVPLVAELAPPA